MIWNKHACLYGQSIVDDKKKFNCPETLKFEWEWKISVIYYEDPSITTERSSNIKPLIWKIKTQTLFYLYRRPVKP